MASSGWALQKGVFAALVADGAVVAALGGAKIYDDVPRDVEFPYVTFGQSIERDWSTGSDSGSEHLVSLHIWSRGDGRRQVLEIADAVYGALHDASLVLSGNRLVNFRHEFSNARREPDGETFRGVVRFRAATEVAP